MIGAGQKRGVRLIVAGVCLAAGAALVAWPIVRSARSRLWESRNASRVEGEAGAGADARGEAGRPAAGDRAGESPVPDGAVATGRDPAAPAKRPRRGEAIARLRIPRVGLDSVIAEGTDRATLARGPGHMEGTALPGAPDNCIIAGHRDGEFARLGSVREGDVVEIVAEGARSHYRVTGVSIVDKEDTAVLDPSDEPLLTLVTCYPFRWVGPAPKRLIVRGALIPSPV